MAFKEMSEAEVLLLLQKREPTLILSHVNPDADAVGSALALSMLLSAFGVPALCLFGSEVPQRLSFLTKAGGEPGDPAALPQEFENARAVAVDAASPAQLGELFGLFGDRIVLSLDHHGMNTPYAPGICRPAAAATGEIIYDLAAASGAELPPAAALCLYAAICGDTGSFKYSNTTPQTLLRAAALMEIGHFDVAELTGRLFGGKTRLQFRAEQAAGDRVHFFADGKVAITTFPYELKKELGVTEEELGTLVDIARPIEGVSVSAALRQPEEAPVFRASLRANDDVDVSAVCATFGGGGHRRAAGATIEAPDIETAEKMLLDAILKAL